METVRWNESQTDSLFYAGQQSYINRQFNFSNGINANNYYFNMIEQPVNMVTGYQRQHRKNIGFQNVEGSDNYTTDQYTKVITHNNNIENIHGIFSKSVELSCVAGMNLMQPYLDFNGSDPAQGQLKVKIWEFNAFKIDPFFRNPDMSDCRYIWTQEYISRMEAEERFPDKMHLVRPMQASGNNFSTFYFLPEAQNAARNDMLVISYVWYKWHYKKQRLYSKKWNQFFDFAGGNENLERILYHIPDLTKVTVTAPCWKCARILNESLIDLQVNPLGDFDCPMVMNYWNYDPHLNQYGLRNRSLVRSMRDPQALFNFKVITNNDISAATINSGWKRKVGAVANEDNLKKGGSGYDVLVNEGYEMTDVEKILPNAVPESDLAMAQQMADLLFKVSGIDLENWSGQQDKQSSSLTLLIKQASNLMVFQKYFDQWDHSLKLLGEKMLAIVLNNWNAEKIGLMIGEEPSPHFYSKVFAKYKTVVEESDLTPTQQNLQAQQMLEINERFGREVFPPSKIVPKLNITGKGELIPYLEEQEQKAASMEQEQQLLAHAFEDAKLKELYSRATANIARAREDHSRSESNLGLYEERLSMIERNRSMSLKEKQAALTSLLENIEKFGIIETEYRKNQLDVENMKQRQEEEIEKRDVESRTESNKFIEQIMTGMPGQQEQISVPSQQNGL